MLSMLLIINFTLPTLQGGDDDYEFHPDHFDDPYTEEELAKIVAAKTAAASAASAPAPVPETVFKSTA